MVAVYRGAFDATSKGLKFGMGKLRGNRLDLIRDMIGFLYTAHKYQVRSVCAHSPSPREICK